MEFNEKLQELRKQKGMTQEELAEALWVSRAAVSKWESGRGYPSIDSLKEIAKFFSVSIDTLLSGDQVLTIAEEDRKQTESRCLDLIFGLLDLSAASFLFLPIFGQQTGSALEEPIESEQTMNVYKIGGRWVSEDALEILYMIAF
jgi:transcriptional regulator with XRE-family HTH domain